jgi:hypothetical protein
LSRDLRASASPMLTEYREMLAISRDSLRAQKQECGKDSSPHSWVRVSLCLGRQAT